MYIQGTGNISPQNTFGTVPFLMEQETHTGNRLNAIEPAYKQIIDPKLIRRMSHIIKMGVAAAMQCLKDASVSMPDAIITGTAYGCLEDTGTFLTKLVESDEEVFTPTAFIQSTHNTIGAQIGLLLQCNNYNNAFAHTGGSFESALLDAIMLLEENEVNNVLVGGVDEVTDISHNILSRFGLYRNEVESNLQLFDTETKGTIGGEGAAFFLLGNKPSGNDYAKLNAIDTFYKPDGIDAMAERIAFFLATNNISINDIDLVITGRNGDAKNDEVYTQLQRGIFSNTNCVNYKHLCGEYPTSTAFAMWLAANILKQQVVPEVVSKTVVAPAQINRVLVYNHYQNVNHSLMLLSVC